ncbi:aldo/keto reductase [Microterricola pindariensis]|uniref:NADP-dependent oxidoreductase domain-containing protein n=1 Tax=Microterricola pindariensis TaxID=478010 RepID=A0ABX5AU89_9MICO|nr:aldo/keto reductase [Microterricola pindariensis]PPL17630.1 hypothetical protein GY24_11200 [Microterricola pindariensis]
MRSPRRIGDVDVSPIALGTAGLVFDTSHSAASRAAAFGAAIDAGITAFDTAAAYSAAGEPHSGERMLGDRLRAAGVLGSVAVITKGGHSRRGDSFPIDGRPESIHSHCRGSLAALGVGVIDLYLLHWPDPEVPIEESVGAMLELQRSGLVRDIGVSNVSLEQLHRARSVAPIAAVENKFTLDGTQGEILLAAEAAGIAYLGYSPLGIVRDWPLFVARPEVAAIAAQHSADPQQLVIAWLLAQSPTFIPVSGASKPATITSTADAGGLVLSPGELAALGAALSRHPARPDA